MSKLQIVFEGDPVLRKKAREVPKITKETLKLLDQMLDSMRDAQGVGLAAPQVGIDRRICIVDVGDGLYEFINPEIMAGGGSQIDTEGCLSVPGKNGDVDRKYWVEVEATNRKGQRFRLKAEGLFSRAIQHEVDHLDGILFVDRARNIEYVD